MKKPLTVLFNTYAIAFDCPGGGEVQLLQYEKHLIKTGVRVLRYDPWNPQPQFDAADIIHYFSVMGSSWLFCRHVAETRKKPLVISPIVWIDQPEKYNLDEIGWLLGMAAHILPNSQAECAQLSGLFNLSPTRFSPVVNGVDDIFFAPADPEVFRNCFDIREPFVLCMGNIEERKNQLRLIRALKGTGTRLVLAGQDREAEYAVACREEADAAVRFVGMLEHGGELHRSAYAAASVLALPSTLETPGLAALEAGAAGCRLALTREGCAEEYFGAFAQYLDPYDTKSIADTVLSSLAAPCPAGLSRHVRENFTWHRAAKQLLRAYQSVIQGRDQV
jgi:glycosyltransferase involved in cell wall biosynthesis